MTTLHDDTVVDGTQKGQPLPRSPAVSTGRKRAGPMSLLFGVQRWKVGGIRSKRKMVHEVAVMEAQKLRWSSAMFWLTLWLTNMQADGIAPKGRLT